MKKLAKYLKPYTLMILISIALLFGQAMADLNLPNYMSEIVNIGIQQSGIEDAAPEAISAKGLTFVTGFMTEEQKKTVGDSYTLIPSSGSGDSHEDAVRRYPLLKTEDIYVRGSVDSATLTQLDRAFGESAWTLINTMKTLAQQSGKSLTASAGGKTDVSEMDLSKVYALGPVLEKLPAGVIENARGEALKNSESMLLQSGTAMCRSFYRELGMNISGIQTAYILRMGLLMLLIALAGGAATVMVGYFAAKLSAGVARDLRRAVFRKVESFSNREFDEFSTASLITRTTNDVTQVQMLLMMGVRMLCYAPIMGVGGIIMAVHKSVSMSWIIALACVVLVGMIAVVFSVALPKFKIVQQLVDRLNLVSRENLNGLMVIRAFGTQKFEEERFDIANRDLTKNSLFVNRIMVFMMPVMMLIMNASTLLIVWVGAHQIAASAMQVGDMMAFMQYAMQIIMSFLMISIMFIMVPRAAVSGNRIAQVLDVEPSIEDPEHPVSFDGNQTGYIDFKDVSFRYSGASEDVLQHITFTAKPGQTTAFIGSTGSGKTTLVNLIPRFYDVTAGEVLVNGVNVKNVSQKELRDQIGYVPQKGILLSGTIDSNLRYGDKDAAEEDVRTAAEVAQAMEFISEKPEGFHSEIAQGGANVSGGQKQRLSIARALVKKPPVYIFDDSFSALDYKTDAALRSALKRHTGESTVLIVAQRVSTIMSAEQIIVLDEGKIVGIGTHKELLKSCPTYYEIASSQLSKEELA
ncbi:ABC transporter ATP-binding protein [Caproiciproducens sp. CPB-2]|uniref:ABC transporter ATP-binding protein n=1 Tax=Caproiciproducens sp. CPB-2 TaxID=3030017 RepID=UPI0023DB8EE5|nr:ABC transporter ATP-binding protein [Caproiciproducens sp. CPB-2]MDF1493199.1 ABC transporter ATP-binding protein [Caproiciproducens sp. CPB-2]